MNGLMNFWINDYFTDLLLTLTLFLLLYASLRRGRKYAQYKYFPLYFFSFIVLQLVNYSFHFSLDGNFTPKNIAWFGRYLDWFVTIIEYFAFSYFFISITEFQRNKNFIKIAFVVVTLTLQFHCYFITSIFTMFII